GGLRDIQAPGWVGWVLGATVAPASGSSRDLPEGLAGEGWSHGVHALAAQGFLRDGDVQRLRDARDLLLDARVALHRVSGGKSEQLTLQDQDAVAQLLGVSDSDVLLRSIGEAARAVTWIGTDLWTRLRSAERGPTGRGPGEHRVNDLVTLRDGRVWLARDATIDAATALAVAARAAELGAPFERDTLERLATLNEVEWTPTAREEFIALLRAGRGAIPVFETLDHEALLVRLLPEWAHVRARPQRNAYHRFTVDRHSLEAVAECVAVLDDAVVDQAGGPDRGFDARVAGQARPDVLLLAALLHDVGKGRPGDHSVVGVEYARAIAERIGLDDQGTDELSWLVRNHLLLADTATRRDLSDETTISRFGEAVATTERLDALYVLTLGDSRATGPAAWSTSKAALVRELYSKTRQWLTDGVVQSDTVRADQLLAEFADLRAARVPAVRWQEAGHGMLRCVVVAPDRTGLLATVTGSLTLLGFDVEHAAAFTDDGGMAVETFTGAHRFGRLDTDDERARASAAVLAALDGDVGLDQGLRDRAQRYRTAVTRPDQRNIRVTIDNDASKAATLVEVFAPDDVGVLARVAAVFAGLGLDVGQAIVSTHGDRVVDVFYLRDARGAKIVDDRTLDELRSTVLERLASEVSLD
ncbi:MAG: ACT domain-containing protein, partial [Acidimicrobiia bacterium]